MFVLVQCQRFGRYTCSPRTFSSEAIYPLIINPRTEASVLSLCPGKGICLAGGFIIRCSARAGMEKNE
jgi:hypothetical protein